jgi:hypothetical protein
MKSLLEVMIGAGSSETVSGEIRKEQIEVSGRRTGRPVIEAGSCHAQRAELTPEDQPRRG